MQTYLDNNSLSTISRQEASDLLRVSLRTLDRYIKKGLLRTTKDSNKILLYEDDISKLSLKKRKKEKTSYRHVDRQGVDKISNNILDKDIDSRQKLSRHEFEYQESLYKKLYEEVKSELKEKQKYLEGANYKVGQLEAQVKNSIPLLEFYNEKTKLKAREENAEKIVKNKDFEIKDLVGQIQIEKYNKMIYIIILFIILILQPIMWLLK